MADEYRMLIGGDWVASESGATFDATSPSTGEVIGSIPEGTRIDAQRAITAANDAWPAWSGLSAFDRAAAIRRIAAAIDERREDLALTLTLDQGKPLKAEARDEVEELIAYFDMAAADATRLEGLIPPSFDAGKRVFLYRVSRGVVGIISPWNWPYTMPGEIVAPALAAGNAVVLAPAPTTSVCAVKLAECIDAADLPPGAFNLVTGPGPVVGDEVAANPGTAAVGFIGSIATGHTVAARAAGKELLLEMGGNGPLVICEDADLDAAVDATLTACFLNAGQSCTAGERILVQEDVKDDYLARLSKAIEERDPPRRSVRRQDHDGSGQQRADGGQDRASRDRGAGAGCDAASPAGVARRRTGARSSSKPPCWMPSRTRWRSRERRRSARWFRSRRSATNSRRSTS